MCCDPSTIAGVSGFRRILERGLVERRNSPVNWCPSCQTVLANEQVIEGDCWRCDSEIEKRDLTQWYLKITDYAQELLDDLDQLEGWPERVKQLQSNWIGRSEGAEVDFVLCDKDGNVPAEPAEDDIITVFTTRADTLFGASFFVLAPENPGLAAWLRAPNTRSRLWIWSRRSKKITAVERAQGDHEKHGAFTGRYVVNPINGEKLPIWVADYVVADYGTGAVMAVPCGDQRDFEFARKYDLPIIPIIWAMTIRCSSSSKTSRIAWLPPSIGTRPTEAEGTLVQSGKYTGMTGGKHSERRRPSSADLEAQGRADVGWSSVCAIGLFPVSAIGATLSRLFTATTAASCRSRRRAACSLPEDIDLAAGETLATHEAVRSVHVPEVRRSLRVARPTPWTRSRARAGITCAIPIRTTPSCRSIPTA